MDWTAKMNEPDFARFRTLISDRLAELETALDAARGGTGTVELDQQKVGRLSRMDAIQQQAMARASADRLAQTRRRLTAGLARLEAGEFGYCDDCGEPIPPKRLEIDPGVTRCVSCQTG